jgi:hypothetical protein
MRAVCKAHLILLDLITVSIHGCQLHKTVKTFFHLLAYSSLSPLKVLLNAIFSSVIRWFVFFMGWVVWLFVLYQSKPVWFYISKQFPLQFCFKLFNVSLFPLLFIQIYFGVLLMNFISAAVILFLFSICFVLYSKLKLWVCSLWVYIR